MDESNKLGDPRHPPRDIAPTKVGTVRPLASELDSTVYKSG